MNPAAGLCIVNGKVSRHYINEILDVNKRDGHYLIPCDGFNSGCCYAIFYYNTDNTGYINYYDCISYVKSFRSFKLRTYIMRRYTRKTGHYIVVKYSDDTFEHMIDITVDDVFVKIFATTLDGELKTEYEMRFI